MRLPRFERDVIERWVSEVDSNFRWARGRADIDLHKRQGGLLGNLLNGGTSLIGDILGTNPKSTTTTQAKPTTTQVVSSPPPPAITQAPPPATTQAPVVSAPAPSEVVAPPKEVTPSKEVTPPVQVITAPAPAPTSQDPQPAPVLSSVTQKISTIPVAIPVITLNPTSQPGNGVLPTTTAITFVSATSIVSLISTSFVFSTITSNGVVYPTTFVTSILTSPSTTRPIEDMTTMNAVMGTNMSGMGGISRMTIIITILSIFFGSLFIFLVCYYISQNYIKKRKITIALDMRISQLQQGDGPLPPVPMRERMRNDAMEFMLRFPRPPSLKGMGMGRTSREKARGGFEILR